MKSILYEPLIEFDQLDPTAAGTHYWLATAYAFQNGGKDLQITVRTGVKFSDGSSFGPTGRRRHVHGDEQPEG